MRRHHMQSNYEEFQWESLKSWAWAGQEFISWKYGCTGSDGETLKGGEDTSNSCKWFSWALIDCNRIWWIGMNCILWMQGHNVILLSNHQTEADPAVMALLLEHTHPYLAENLVWDFYLVSHEFNFECSLSVFYLLVFSSWTLLLSCLFMS